MTSWVLGVCSGRTGISPAYVSVLQYNDVNVDSAEGTCLYWYMQARHIASHDAVQASFKTDSEMLRVRLGGVVKVGGATSCLCPPLERVVFMTLSMFN